MIRRISFTFLLVVAFSSVGMTQQPIQSAEFSTLAWSRTIKDLHYQGVDGELVKMWIPNGSPSKVYEYRGTFPVQFFRIIGTDDAGKPIKELAAEYMPAGRLQEQLLIFIADPASEQNRYRLLPFRFSKDEAQENTYRFINLSDFPVFVKFGSERFSVAKHSEKSMTTGITASGGQSIAMAIQVSEQPNDLKLAYSSSWSVRSGRSALVFVTTEPSADDKIAIKKLYY
ncbi:hypothetical protein QEH52_07365 [Coraliomargarita sp. SDUM461003]|uniref:Uncharacterized protein n=1 Tax=Thalassobacterium maritimum TaxID=3041265 RepID=A0ABU1ATB3_9BACT|nr:hypothetical protein [Coraliomargarita sp. SDUM461003]MDQ8207321.1 hypothetical protein [Coraliomargarita sp. SDUM461003]